jgi:hypothetical protein
MLHAMGVLFSALILFAGRTPQPMHPKSPLASLLEVLVIVLAVLALLAVVEFFLAKGSRWSALADKFKNRQQPATPWKAAQFLHMEFIKGRTRHITTYRAPYEKTAWSIISGYFFPVVSVAAAAEGLHLKRPPWKWAHPPLLIPWSVVGRAEEMSQTDFAAVTSNLSVLKGGAEAMKGMMGKRLPRFLDAVGGPVMRLYVVSPEVVISVPAAALSEARRHLENKVEQRSVEALTRTNRPA